MINTSVGRARCQALLTDFGRANPTTLNADEVGMIAYANVSTTRQISGIGSMTTRRS